VRGGGGGGGTAGAAGASAVVRLDTSPPTLTGRGLTVVRVDDRIFHVVPDALDGAAEYAVTGTGLSALNDVAPLTFEILDGLDPDVGAMLTGAGITDPGVTVRVQTADGDPPTRGFALRVEPIGGGA
jgi:hypothetical protein